MRVLQVIAGAEYGGAESYFVRLTLALARAGIGQRVAMRSNRARAARLRAGGLEPVEMGFGGGEFLLYRIRVAHQILATSLHIGPDCVRQTSDQLRESLLHAECARGHFSEWCHFCSRRWVGCRPVSFLPAVCCGGGASSGWNCAIRSGDSRYR